MPDKTPLELAREVQHGISAGSRTAARSRAKAVAAALVERMTPVRPASQETIEGTTSGTCACSWWVRQFETFCPNCGKPLVWK